MDPLTFIPVWRDRLQSELPGAQAHGYMSHPSRGLHNPIPATAKNAAVLLALYPENSHWHTVLMQRTHGHQQDRHSGQISFPGGSMEASDPSLEFTALREAHEEVGIPPHQVEIIGTLSPLYIPVSNFLVHPYVGILPHRPSYQLQESEALHLYEPSLQDLSNPANHKTGTIHLPQGLTLKEVPYFDVQGAVVWGATAMILSELLAAFKLLPTYQP